jgi:hypothetical protein
VTREWAVPHAVEFDPQLREAFLTIESYFHDLEDAAGRMAGIFWWDGNGAPNPAALTTARGGDFYIDRITGDVYRLLEGDYTRSLGGGEDESELRPGSMWWDDDDPPSSTAAPYRVQDYWLDTDTCDIWRLS